VITSSRITSVILVGQRDLIFRWLPHQFIMLAIAEKIATLSTMNYLEERAKRGSREKFLAVLAKAPDVEPEEYDGL
jgi:hypothetical protein